MRETLFLPKTNCNFGDRFTFSNLIERTNSDTVKFRFSEKATKI